MPPKKPRREARGLQLNMEQLEEERATSLIHKICFLTESLTTEVPEAQPDSKIYSVFSGEAGETHWHTTNRRFDAAFGADTLIPGTQKLRYIERGQFGMDIVADYLKQALDPEFLGTLPLEIFIPKLETYTHINNIL